MPLLLLFLLSLPVVELIALTEVGAWIGLWPTLGLTLLAMVSGVVILRRQGYATLETAQKCLARRENPLPPVLHGMTVMFAGALLVIPGFVTDVIALLLLISPLRAALGRVIWSAFAKSGRVNVWAARGETVIEGEYREVKEEPKRLG